MNEIFCCLEYNTEKLLGKYYHRKHPTTGTLRKKNSVLKSKSYFESPALTVRLNGSVETKREILLSRMLRRKSSLEFACVACNYTWNRNHEPSLGANRTFDPVCVPMKAARYFLSHEFVIIFEFVWVGKSEVFGFMPKLSYKL
jgi:hypothetical protein